MTILLKRVGETPSPKDGARVLVDRDRPSALRDESPESTAWLPELAPSEELRRWFAARPRPWPGFRRRYLAELCAENASHALSELHTIADGQRNMTLLTAARDQEHSHAAILRDLLEGMKKPPGTSGPSRAASGEGIRARRNP